MKRHALLVLTLLFMTACIGSQKPAPVTSYGVSAGAGTTGVHTVVHGDTLYSISERYKIVMRDIVISNTLRAPFRLEVGQRIKLPPPQEYKVRPGDSLYTVSRLFGLNTSELVAMNNLRQPYTLRAGQKLRLPSLAKKAPPAPAKPVQQASLVRPGQKPQMQEPPVKQANIPSPAKAKITAKTPKRSSSKFLKPVDGKTLSSYGPKEGGLHNDGINIAAPKGAPVRAAENGVVVYAGNELKGSGNLVLVRHEGRWMTAYAHMDRILIKRGQTVKRGQSIGTVGSSGSVDRPQLHFEVRRGTEALNPKRYVEG